MTNGNVSCLIIHLGNKNSLYSYHISDFILSNPLVAKYLGVTIDNPSFFLTSYSYYCFKS